MKHVYFKSLVYAVLMIIIVNVSSQAETAFKWKVDKANTSVNFRIWHIMTPVNGKFDDFDIDLYFDPDNLEGSSINVTIQTASINTGWGPRDEHLRTEDWFYSDEFPVMSFKSSKITSTGDGNYIAKGKIKIREVETDIELPFKLLGIKQIPENMQNVFDGSNEVASFEISNFSLNRKDYNVGTGTTTPGEAAMTYRDVVGNTVTVNITIEANRKITE
jgi:polyisoprenoid-binding protein YceI